jgi:p-cumate 2,3-dioxygenase subunit beta
MSAPYRRAEVTYAAVMAFLFREARLLDEWQLPEWELLFADDGRYLVPPAGIVHADAANPDNMLFLVADDRLRIHQRCLRLMKTSAHAEYPHSRTRHMLSNIEVLGEDAQGLRVSAYFSTYHVRQGEISVYMGQLLYVLVRSNDSFRIREKRACLDLDALQPQGALAFIL